jgi:branched-chain amino acid transport system substrate-binding protein
VKTPFPGTDFSSYLLQAQSSGAKVVGLANAGGDTIASIKQAGEFGIVAAGQKLAGLLVYVTDVHALGLEAAQGLVLTSPFYWDLNDETRAWSQRFGERHGGKMPTMLQAGAYSGLTHYLKAVEATKSTDAATVLAKMKELPTDDPLFGEGYIRKEDGRKVHNMYLFEVKTPSESTGPWDYYKQIAVLPGEETIRPLAESECPLVNN